MSGVLMDDWRLQSVECKDYVIEGLRKELHDGFPKFMTGPVSEDWLAWGKRWKIIQIKAGPALVVSD